MIDCTSFGSTHVVGTLRDFTRFESWLEKSQKVTDSARFGSTHVVGTLRAFLRVARCQECLKCSVVAQCTDVVYVLGTLCDLLPIKRCLEGQGYCGHCYLHVERGGPVHPCILLLSMGGNESAPPKPNIERTGRNGAVGAVRRVDGADL